MPPLLVSAEDVKHGKPAQDAILTIPGVQSLESRLRVEHAP